MQLLLGHADRRVGVLQQAQLLLLAVQRPTQVTCEVIESKSIDTELVNAMGNRHYTQR